MEGGEAPLRLLAQSPLHAAVPETDGLGAAGVMLHPRTTALLTGAGTSILWSISWGEGDAGGHRVLLTPRACCCPGLGSLPTPGIVLAACRKMREQVKCCMGGTGV